MKVLIPILIGLLVVGCGEGKTEKPLSPEEKVVGDYTLKDEDGKWMLEFCGDVVNGEADDWKFYRCLLRPSMPILHVDIGRWKLVGKEVHVRYESVAPHKPHRLSEAYNGTTVYKIESNGDLIQIASIPSGKRVDVQKEFQRTFKKKAPYTLQTEGTGGAINTTPTTSTNLPATTSTNSPATEKPKR